MPIITFLSQPYINHDIVTYNLYPTINHFIVGYNKRDDIP